jgi:hypothetical protein
MASTILTQIEELADSLASIQKKHHLTEQSVVKIAEMVFSNYWSGRQMELQATAAGYTTEAPDYLPIDQTDDEDGEPERLNGTAQIDDENGEA